MSSNYLSAQKDAIKIFIRLNMNIRTITSKTLTNGTQMINNSAQETTTDQERPTVVPASRPKVRMQLGDITPHNIKLLKRINGIVFPVNYNARFYDDVLSTTNIAKFAYFNDIVVGAMCCRILLVNNEKKLYIMTLGCLPNYRRFGLGTMMLEHVFDYCRKNNSISGIFLHVQVNNDVALEFYRKFGFEVHSVVENYYKRITPADAFLLVKRLEGGRRNDNVKELQLV